MAIIIRSLRPHDHHIAASLHARCFDMPGERAWTADEFARLLRMPGCFGLLLIAEGQPCGIALARIAADEAELLTLGVIPGARRRGGARSLVSVLQRRSRRRGARHMFLEVADDNMAARRLYEAYGFASVARRADYFDRGRHGRVAAHVMRLDFDTLP
jgi:ribosomal-protein-alanine N-acetyltransferase